MSDERRRATDRVERDGPITTIVMARSERRNAVDREMSEGLRAAIRAFETDEARRVEV